MSKWCSYGYFPPGDSETRKVREIEDELLREYLPIVLTSSEQILATPRYFYCQLANAYLSSPYVFGGGPIPLGVLLLLWDAGAMRFECPSCGGSLHAIGVAGSILSGSGSAWGICTGCRTAQRVTKGRFGRTISAVGKLLPRYRNEPIIEKGGRPRFDWKDGLTGESAPDRVIVPAVEAVDFWGLVCELTGREVGDYRRKPVRSGLSPATLLRPLTLEKKRR